MRLYLLRHGETDLNRDMRLQGQIDYPLNQVGIEQARQAGRHVRELGLTFDAIYCSPLQRAVDTVTLMTGAPLEQVIIDDRLLEMGYGPYDALPFTSLSGSVLDFFREPERFPTPEGIEPIEDVLARTRLFLDEMATRDDLDDVLVSTHGVAIRSFMGNILRDGAGAVWSRDIENCTLYVTEFVDGHWTPPTDVR